MQAASLIYRCILLKLSGEALGIPTDPKVFQAPTFKISPIHADTLLRIAQEIRRVVVQGVQVGIVIGGGNWFRGNEASIELGLDRITADHMGMLATMMNALALQNALEKQGLEVCVMSALPVGNVIEAFGLHRAKRHLQKQRVVIFAGGTGHPLVSTDTAASLRALEIKADILLKATSIDGVYSADPTKYPDAEFYTHLTYQQVISTESGVMDLAAFCQCRDHGLPIRVFNINTPKGLLRIMQGEDVGTLISDS